MPKKSYSAPVGVDVHRTALRKGGIFLLAIDVEDEEEEEVVRLILPNSFEGGVLVEVTLIFPWGDEEETLSSRRRAASRCSKAVS